MLVEHLILPDNLPTQKAIESFGDNSNSYDPVFWEFQYQIHRSEGSESI